MPTRRKLVLTAITTPLVLLQLDLGCLGLVLGGGTGVTGPGFNLPPTVVISADVTRGIVPLTVNLSSAGSSDDGLIVRRLWNFGDGQTSPDISPRHTFQTIGEFTVTLTLTDDRNATTTRSITIFVTQQPQAVIRVDRTTAETAPATFNFDASQSSDPDGAVVAYQWDFGDGSRELLPVVPHTFASPGTYRVRLTVTDDTGITGSADQVIEVGIPRPTIAFQTPPAGIRNIVVTNDSPLWIHTVFNIEPGVPRMIRAGLDGDVDPCNSQTVVFDANSGSESLVIEQHDEPVTSVSFSPDGNFILTGSLDRRVNLHSAETGRLINSIGGVLDGVTSVSFSPDGGRFLEGTVGGVVLLRTRSPGNVILEFAGHASAVNGVAFSPNGALAASASDDLTAIVWDATSGAATAVLAGHAAAVQSVAFNPVNAGQVVTGSADRTAILWNANDGGRLGAFAPVFDGDRVVSGHSGAIRGVAFSPDGTILATASDDRTAILWDVAARSALRTLTGHTGAVTAIAFSPNGARVTTGSADGTVREWDVASGAVIRRLQPCSSTIASVAYAPDGSAIVAGVGAKNDIRLDTNPPNGNDLNATVPIALDLRNVPAGRYSLWAEIDTDRTSPTRTYSEAVVNVIAPFTNLVDGFTPQIPLVDDEASVIVAETTRRQIFDIGPLLEGDQIEISLLSTPGYSATYSDSRFSVMILDGDESVFAWYQDGFVRFSPDSRIVAGHSSENYYVVVDGFDPILFGGGFGGGLERRIGASVNLRIHRNAGRFPRVQRVYLDFRGASNIAIGSLLPFNLPPFDVTDYGFAEADEAVVKNEIANTARRLFAAWNVVITTSDEEAEPQRPFQRVYFGGFSDELFGIADFIDPRNDTATGSAVVATGSIREAFPNASASEFGELTGIVTAHEIGHLMGLRHVDNPADVMHGGELLTAFQVFADSPIIARELYNGAIGTQNAPQLLEELFGLRD